MSRTITTSWTASIAKSGESTCIMAYGNVAMRRLRRRSLTLWPLSRNEVALPQGRASATSGADTEPPPECSRLISARGFRRLRFRQHNTAMRCRSAGARSIPSMFCATGWITIFHAGVFDAVLSIESSEHMQDKEMFFAQAYRVLRAGGRTVICAWLSSESPTALQRRHLLEPICREGRIPGMGAESEYRKWLSDAGLVLESFEDVSARVRKTWTICVRRLLLNLLRQPGLSPFPLE